MNEQEPADGERNNQPEVRLEQGDLRPQIWVGSWIDYTNGQLHGAWLDATADPETIRQGIEAMLAASPWTAQTGQPAEDWGVFDSQDFGTYVAENDAVERISVIGRGIAAHGLAYAAWAELASDDDRLSDFEEAFLGHHQSVESYVEQLVDDLGYEALLDAAISSGLRPYVQIDITAMARDMTLSGDITTVTAVGGGVWIFDPRLI